MSPTEARSVVRSWPLGAKILRPSTKKRVVLSGAILDLRRQHLQAIHLRRRLTGDGRACPAHRARGARPSALLVTGDPLDAGQILIQPQPALREGLRVRADALDAFQRLHAPHQVVMDAQFHLAADPSAEEFKNRSRVLMTMPSVEFSMATTPKSALAGLHFVKHLIHRAQRQRAHRVTEMLQHRGLGEGAFGTQERDLERLLLRQARGHDFAEQPQHLLGRAAGP